MKEEMKNKLMNVVRSVVAFGLWFLVIGAVLVAEAGSPVAFIIFSVCAYGYVKLANWTFDGVEDEDI